MRIMLRSAFHRNETAEEIRWKHLTFDGRWDTMLPIPLRQFLKQRVLWPLNFSNPGSIPSIPFFLFFSRNDCIPSFLFHVVTLTLPSSPFFSLLSLQVPCHETGPSQYTPIVCVAVQSNPNVLHSACDWYQREGIGMWQDCPWCVFCEYRFIGRTAEEWKESGIVYIATCFHV